MIATQGASSVRYLVASMLILATLGLAVSCIDTSPSANQKTFVSPDGRYWLRHEYANVFSPTTSYSAIYIGDNTGEVRIILKVDRLVLATHEWVEWNDTPSSVALVADLQGMGYYRLHVLLENLSVRLDRHNEEFAVWSPTVGILPEDGIYDAKRIDSVVRRMP